MVRQVHQKVLAEEEDKMNSIIKKYSLKYLLVVALLVSNVSFSQNETDAVRLAVPGIVSNARALSMGNSYLTRSGDYSAMFFNPAGLALSNHSQLTGSFYHRFQETGTTFFGNEDSDKNSNTQFSQLGYLYKAPTTRGSFVYGLGYQTDKDFSSALNFNGYNPNRNSMIQDLTAKNDDVPYLLGLSYPLYDIENNYIKDTTHINGRLSQSGSLYEEGGIDRYSFGAGIEVAKGIYFGGSLNYLSGKYSNNREYYEDDWAGNYTSPTDINDSYTKNFNSFFLNDEISWNMNAWELRFGFIMDWLNFIRIGASAKLPTTYNIKENYYFEAYSKFDDDYFIDILPTDSQIEYKITTPMEFSFGGSINLNIVNINAQATFVDYSQIEFSGDLDQTIVKNNNRIINSNFKSTLNLNLGAEVKIPFTQIRARAGAMYLPSPYKEDPTSFNKLFLTAGAGIVASDALTFDIAYSYGFWESYSDNYGVNQSQVFQNISSHTVLISTTIMY